MCPRAFRSFLATVSGVVLACTGGWASAQTLYRITAIDTVGAPGGSRASAMNDAGQVTGTIDFDDLVAHAFLWDGTRLTDLGTLGRSGSLGNAINALGQVAGTAYDDEFDEYDGFRFAGGTLENLGTLGGWVTHAYAINASGQVTGRSNPAGRFQPHAFLSTGSTMQDLGTFGGVWSEGFDINDTGQVTGRASFPGELDMHAFLWDGSKLRDLGTLGGRVSRGNAINASGQVTGQAEKFRTLNRHAFLWDGVTMLDLGTLGGPVSEGTAINRAGMVTGSATLKDSSTHAFLWNGTLMLDLGALGGTFSKGNAINASGQVTGSASLPGSSLAFLSDGGPMVDLNGLIDSSDPLKPHVVLQSGVDINRRGQVAANGLDTRTFVHHAYLVTPLQYRIRYLAPTAGSTWPTGATVPVRAALIGVDGKRIDDARASALDGACKVKFSANRAGRWTTTCMHYDASANEFFIEWLTGATESPAVRLEVAATYRFNMPETITTTRSRSVAIVQ
jgi:probable HAF family extracellular repeat protein